MTSIRQEAVNRSDEVFLRLEKMRRKATDLDSFQNYSKSSKVQLYIIIMKPFIEVAGGNYLPAICHAQRRKGISGRLSL